jgi:hypothetical protein
LSTTSRSWLREKPWTPFSKRITRREKEDCFKPKLKCRRLSLQTSKNGKRTTNSWQKSTRGLPKTSCRFRPSLNGLLRVIRTGTSTLDPWM